MFDIYQLAFEVLTELSRTDTIVVKLGESRGAFRFKAVCVKVFIGSSVGAVLATLAKPTVAAVKPFTVEENVTGPEELTLLRHVVDCDKTVGINMLSWVFEYVNA